MGLEKIPFSSQENLLISTADEFCFVCTFLQDKVTHLYTSTAGWLSANYKPCNDTGWLDAYAYFSTLTKVPDRV